MGNGTALAKRPVMELIQASRVKFEGRLPQGMTVDRFCYGLATAVQKNPDLAACDPPSIILAAYEAAELGCDLSPSLALGWLVPYRGVAQFQPSYRFFIQRAYATGLVSAFFGEVVFEHDLFTRAFAPKRTIRHEPGVNDQRGEPIGAYALIEFKDGHIDWEYLSKEQIERHRKASKMPDSLMWRVFWEEAWRKTALRTLAKRLPITSPGMETLAEIVNTDAERDRDPVIPGALELEEHSPLAERTIAAPTLAPAPQAPTPALHGQPATGKGPVIYKVNRMLTTLSGAVKDTFRPRDLKHLGLRITHENEWNIPASLTADFVAYCEQKNIPTLELDPAAPDPAAPPIDDSDLPGALFREGETPSA